MLQGKVYYLSQAKILAQLKREELAELAESFARETHPADACLATA